MTYDTSDIIYHLKLNREFFRQHPPVVGKWKRIWDNYYKYNLKIGDSIDPQDECVKCGHKIGSHTIIESKRCGLM